MSQSLSQTFLAITRNSTDLEWLQGALAPLGQVVSAGGGSLDELLALVDVTFASLVFVGLDREHVVAQSALIEGALEAKPMLAIVALGDGMDNQLVLNAMRAGAHRIQYQLIVHAVTERDDGKHRLGLQCAFDQRALGHHMLTVEEIGRASCRERV